MKINSIIAKALASKVYNILRDKNKNWETKQRKKVESELKNDSLFIEYKKQEKIIDNLIYEKNKLVTEIKKKYNIKTEYNGFKTIYFHDFKNPIPDIDSIKNDILLMSWENNEMINSDELVKELIKKYSK